MMADEAAQLLTALGTLCGPLGIPITVIALAIIFRKEIHGILSRIHKAKIAGVDLEMRPDEEKVPPIELPKDAQERVRWERTNNLWWFNSDLVVAANVVGVAGRGAEAVDMLRRVHHHAEQLNLGEAIVGKLLSLRNDVARRADSEWTDERRESIRNELWSIFNGVAALAKTHQIEHDPEGALDPP